MDNFHHYLLEAYKYAMEFSTDPSTANAALLVDSHGKIIVKAANSFPRGVKETPVRWERPLKYQYVEHAERNAIFQAARLGICTQGLTMFCPWFACTDCARAIIQAGITTVIGHDSHLHSGINQWEESVKHADIMLQEANIIFIRIKGFFNMKLRFQGKMVDM